MDATRLTDELSSHSQLELFHVAEAAAAGYKSIICDRPNGEAAGQPSFAAIAAEAKKHGLQARYVPVVPGKVTHADVAAFREAFDELPKPILGYCASGKRTTTLAKAAGLIGVSTSTHDVRNNVVSLAHGIVIVGGGAGGIAVAASLLARATDLDIAIIEPDDVHYYQPGWTMVGAGIFTPEETRRSMTSVMPSGVTWIKVAVATFDPDGRSVTLEDGRTITYEKLVVAPGLKLDWDAIEGLSETLGQNGVTSNYRYDLAPYTWKLVEALKGGSALFTQPPMPIKCAGAPQKAMYLSCDTWRSEGVLKAIDVEFLNAGPVLFGVADYVPPLMEYVKAYGIGLSFGCNLIRVDGAAKTAWFKKTSSDGSSEIVERKFDMLHVVPPQKAPDFVRSSPLAGDTGWIDVDQATLRHKRYPDIYSLGDVMSAPNAKTAAAARKQAPVVAENILLDMGRTKKGADFTYDGYGSCPLTVERGKVVLAEFAYGGRRVPSFPKWLIDDLKPSRLAWQLKAKALPALYWQAMLKGRELLAKPHRS
ncbi:bifunctional protein tyrosine phosphatase family protein/NAD(P)/FAD-dependent oxidoreductase [Beijerinckia sp. L45]|uniref:bifunctional protein tyrosine phosphatase family protein/NAD(P)/FAD-dependent oxidoreductase n=1 Tax=Beijerinckia sp. L45 TaxID=1641855 RepID=UPI00131C3F2A|nr:bifunctional protein tyrosine phosphatase family protein/NAD(P)/FAD-dependent oxidoreductase [Beijerinckia sp. L45]